MEIIKTTLRFQFGQGALAGHNSFLPRIDIPIPTLSCEQSIGALFWFPTTPKTRFKYFWTAAREL
jgi:hypothetical protein